MEQPLSEKQTKGVARKSVISPEHDLSMPREEKTLDVFDVSESVRMTEAVNFLASVSDKKEGATLASQKHNQEWLAVPCIVLQT